MGKKIPGGMQQSGDTTEAERQKLECKETYLWIMVVELVQYVYSTGRIPYLMACQVMVLVLKASEGQYRGIGLTDCIRRVVCRVINTRLTKAIEYHPFVHGFRPDRGTQTAVIEVKLQASMAELTERPCPRSSSTWGRPTIQCPVHGWWRSYRDTKWDQTCAEW